MRTITRIVVKKLLGEYSHAVDFPAEDEFVVLIGPNGVGKTRLLELVHATFRANFRTIIESEFDVLTFNFSDGARLEIDKTSTESDFYQLELGLEPTVRKFEMRPHFKLVISGAGEEPFEWKPAYPNLTDLKKMSGHERDMALEAVYRGQLIVDPLSLQADDSPWSRELARSLRHRITRNTEMDAPEAVSDFLSSVTVHLIETQRLVIFRAEQENRREPERRKTNTVEEFASHLRQQIADVLAQNSRTTQKLDRSFPKRVLATSPLESNVTDGLIRERYSKQSAFRDALEDIGVLDMQEDVPISEDTLDDWQRRVLSVYLDDTDVKLSTFQWLLDRINLLSSIVNARFLGKSLKVDRETGFRFELNRTGRRLDPSQLSSGEQHEIVLLYDLLFNVKEGSIVLIDEPEISLNVAWQRQFLVDIQRIANLASLRFVIATHSPQIIHKWSSRVSPLGPLEAGEAE